MRHNPGYGIMPQFMKTGAVIVDLLEECGLRRRLNVIAARHVIGPISANAKIRPCCGDQRLRLGDDLALGQDRGVSKKMFWQAVTLRDVEDGKALEKRHSSGRIAVVLRALTFAFWNETVSITNGRAALTFSNVAAQVQGLAKGQPVLAGEARLKDRAPQDQNINPGIAPSGGGVPGQAKPRFGPAPRLHPRHAALFKFGDNPVRDLAVEIGFFQTLAGTLMLAGVTHDLPSARSKNRTPFPGSGVGGEMRLERPGE